MRKALTGLTVALVLIGSTQMATRKLAELSPPLYIGAKQIITDGQKAVEESLDRARATGSALISQTASSASILIQTINMELSGNLSDARRDLCPEEVTILGKISDLTEQLNGLQAAAYDFKDSTVIDLSQSPFRIGLRTSQAAK